MRLFDNFVAIDWSGAKGERQKGIAVARCGAGDDVPVLVMSERRWSRAEVLEWLGRDLPSNSLVGLDLSPGLPFDPVSGYFPGWSASPADAPELWKLVDQFCAGDPHLAASSFVSHPEARRYFRHGRGDCGDLFGIGTGRLRLTEQRQKVGRTLSPSSCFNLVGAAQVGKSSLTGMRVLNRLRGLIPVWPFDPVPAQGSLIVEIYTSIAARDAGIPPGRSKMLTGEALDAALRVLRVGEHAPLPRYTDDATDAILTAAWLRDRAGNEALWSPAGMTAEIALTKGWTFGVP